MRPTSPPDQGKMIEPEVKKMDYISLALQVLQLAVSVAILVTARRK